jgi:hypothetical protein
MVTVAWLDQLIALANARTGSTAKTEFTAKNAKSAKEDELDGLSRSCDGEAEKTTAAMRADRLGGRKTQQKLAALPSGVGTATSKVFSAAD